MWQSHVSISVVRASRFLYVFLIESSCGPQDPAAEEFQYEVSLDVRELISLEVTPGSILALTHTAIRTKCLHNLIREKSLQLTRIGLPDAGRYGRNEPRSKRGTAVLHGIFGTCNW